MRASIPDKRLAGGPDQGSYSSLPPIDEAKIAETEETLAAATRVGRDATKKDEAIENAVYDLKAVNPNRNAEVDKRTPTELMDVIEAKGAEIAEALAGLRKLNAVRRAY